MITSLKEEEKSKAKMRTVDVAVQVMAKEGVGACFGVPGAAINPLYSAMKKFGALQHILARHGGGIINADAAPQLVQFAEITGLPVIPTLTGWGAIPDDHPLMAGMAGLQTSHRYGNATMLASDFVLGIAFRSSWRSSSSGSPTSRPAAGERK